jgi:hypothetical protein
MTTSAPGSNERPPALLKFTPEAVVAHLTLLQGVIARMANNSSSCKAWCTTLVSAILVVVADKDKPEYMGVAIIATVMFTVLDAYYLAIERGFRESYNAFVGALHENDETVTARLFVISRGGNTFVETLRALISPSVWALYLPLLVLTAAIMKYVL